MATVGAPVRKVARRRYFYGWNIVGVGFLAAIGHMPQLAPMMGVFIKPMGGALGFGRGAMAGVQTIARLIEALLAPFIGPMVDRGWGRWMMVIGGIVVGVGFIALSQVKELWQLYAIKAGFISFGLVGYGFLVVNVTIIKWFSKKRGRALAVMGMGGALGGMVILPLVSWVVDTWGWPYGWVVIGIMILILVPLPAGIFMRRQPEDMGLLPDGEPPLPEAISSSARRTAGETGKGMAAGEVSWTRGEAMRSRTFWLLIAAFVTAHMGTIGVMMHLIPYLEDHGFAPTLAASVLSVRFAVNLVGTPIWGLAAERMNLRHLSSFEFLVFAVGLFGIWFFPTSVFWVFLSIAIMGFSMAGLGILSEMLFARYYGRANLGKVRGAAAPFLEGMGAPTPLILGVVYDVTGSYSGAFVILIVLLFMAAILIQFCKAPQRRESLA